MASRGHAAGRGGRNAPPTELQALWLRRMRQDLPAAAARHPEWPIRLDHCFGRVILDAVCGAPWREVVASAAWRHLSLARLEAAVALADAILAGSVHPGELNAASLRLRRLHGGRSSPELVRARGFC